MTAQERSMGNCNPSKSNVNTGFLSVTISHVTLSCSQYLYNIPLYISIMNGTWEMIHISPFGIMWRNPCFSDSKSCQLYIDFTFSMWRWPFIFCIRMLKLFVFDKLLFQINPLLLRKFVDWINVTKLIADNLIHMKQKILDIQYLN